MDWMDEGFVLSRRRLGETDAVATVFTRDHGRHLGVVRGGAGRRLAATLQTGMLVQARWRARLPEHLGHFTCELISAEAAQLLEDSERLSVWTAALELLDLTLPERVPHPELFAATRALLPALDSPFPAAILVRWEIGVLAALGFGLDLTRCAVTGTDEDLAHVSPRSGRAVSREAGRAHADRLLVLPRFLRSGEGGTVPDAADVLAGLALTGHFLSRHLLGQHREGMPLARRLLVERQARGVTVRRP
jgi:DNA repair protein RecO (recombination protein O)